jgi:predicted DNA-binding transcriptional regulator AlpA
VSEERLITPEDLSDRYSVPVGTIYAWRYKGTGPPGFRVGRHLRFRVEDILAWESEQLRRENGSRR